MSCSMHRTVAVFVIPIILSVVFNLQFLTAEHQTGKKWALLIAGSKHWSNYRHQSDVCQAYHLLRSGGIPEENIVTMMYDDIAFNSRNPDKGTIIHRPGGPDVYQGVVKDYIGKELTIKNFMNILQGDKVAMAGIGSGKVIESGPNDTIFINMVDHGGIGNINVIDEYLFADDLNNVLKKLKKNNKFAKALVFIEACESGSLFENIIDEYGSVLAITASGPRENSHAIYLNDKYKSYLADDFSTAWLELFQQIIHENTNPTLFSMYTNVRSNVTSSNVMVYGDFRIGFDHVFDFMGSYQNHKQNIWTNTVKLPKLKNELSPKTFQEDYEETLSAGSDYDVGLLEKQLKTEINFALRLSIQSKINKLNNERQETYAKIDQILSRILKNPFLKKLVLEKKARLSEGIFPCYKSVVTHLTSNCFKASPFLKDHFKSFINMCEMNINLTELPSVVAEVCRSPKI